MNSAILKVGGGRGFVVTLHRHPGGDERIVITAAHCLPYLPPCHPGRYLHEYTYQRLLGPLDGKRTVWAECVFVDAMADIAVLGSPDNQDLSDQADAYRQLVDSMKPLAVADAPAQGSEQLTFGKYQVSNPTPGVGPARVFSLKGRWLKGQVFRLGGWLSFEPGKHVVGGMSGSPIIDAAGSAIGVVSCASNLGDTSNPVIVDSLSARLVRSIKTRTRQHRRVKSSGANPVPTGQAQTVTTHAK
jgi:hypothetical protein